MAVSEDCLCLASAYAYGAYGGMMLSSHQAASSLRRSSLGHVGRRIAGSPRGCTSQ